MAGVNLSEESARILATNSELVGTQTRSCSDLPILNTAVLQRKMSSVGKSGDVSEKFISPKVDRTKFLSILLGLESQHSTMTNIALVYEVFDNSSDTILHQFSKFLIA